MEGQKGNLFDQDLNRMINNVPGSQGSQPGANSGASAPKAKKPNTDQSGSKRQVDLDGSMVSQLYNLPNLTNNDLEVDQDHTIDDLAHLDTPATALNLRADQAQPAKVQAAPPAAAQKKPVRVPSLNLNRPKGVEVPNRNRKELATPSQASSVGSIPVKTKLGSVVNHNDHHTSGKVHTKPVQQQLNVAQDPTPP